MIPTMNILGTGHAVAVMTVVTIQPTLLLLTVLYPAIDIVFGCMPETIVATGLTLLEI